MSPRKPKRSQQLRGRQLAPVGRASRACALASSDSSTRRSPGDLGRVLREVGDVTVCDRTVRTPRSTTSPASDRPAGELACAAQQPQQRRLARAVDADAAPTRSPGPSRQVDVARARVGAASQARATRPRRRAPASPSRAVANVAAARRGRAAPARRRSARWPPRSGTSACDVRAGGPRRSQASSLRSSFWRRSSRDAACRVALGARQHVGRVAALVRCTTCRRRPPTSRCRRRRGTSGRG